jgi:hypothetical protein
MRSGEEVSEQLDLIPSVLQVIQHTRPKDACSTCKEGVPIPPMPPQPIPKSQATPSLLAHGVTSKYDGRLPLDTHLVENAIRPFVVGRKVWIFADTVGGARASANLYSLVEGAKANRIEP